jgi:hypothetical protein
VAKQFLKNTQKRIYLNSHSRGEGALAPTRTKRQRRFNLSVTIFCVLFTLHSFAQDTNVITKIYKPTDATIINPERGFRSPAEINANSSFSTYYEGVGVSLVHAYVRLDDYREQDIPQAFLDNLQAGFDTMRGSGVKVVLRFAYNFGPYPDTQPDASKDWILRHLEQLTPILQKNADVIAWMQAGFIGAWGEWHTSTNGLDTLQDKQEILFALLGALPKDRTVQVRYPSDIIAMFPEPLADFGDSEQARVGFHNDCFLSSDTDVGTYEKSGDLTIKRDQTYLAELTNFTPTGGETCAVFRPRTDCDIALKELALMHYSELNQSYHAGVIRGWKRQGCFEEIQNRLGYRLSLKLATFSTSVEAGKTLNLSVDLENTGFASLMNVRPLIVVLEGQRRYELATTLDPRSWQPGASSFSVSLPLPADAVAGNYQLALWLPDAYNTLRENPRYAVQFANEGTWNAEKGYNVLGDVQLIGAGRAE